MALMVVSAASNGVPCFGKGIWDVVCVALFNVSPIQPPNTMLIDQSFQTLGYAREVHQALNAAGFFADVDESDNTVSKKIREVGGLE